MIVIVRNPNNAMPEEPEIIINGVHLGAGSAMTVRVAIENFAMDLVNDAIQEGYAIYSMGNGTVYYKTTIMYNTNNETFYYGKEFVRLSNHAYCVTKINGIWYQIEPQDDGITELGKEF